MKINLRITCLALELSARSGQTVHLTARDSRALLDELRRLSNVAFLYRVGAEARRQRLARQAVDSSPPPKK